VFTSLKTESLYKQLAFGDLSVHYLLSISMNSWVLLYSLVYSSVLLFFFFFFCSNYSSFGLWELFQFAPLSL
jgi:hypothetical protein